MNHHDVQHIGQALSLIGGWTFPHIAMVHKQWRWHSGDGPRKRTRFLAPTFVAASSAAVSIAVASAASAAAAAAAWAAVVFA